MGSQVCPGGHSDRAGAKEEQGNHNPEGGSWLPQSASPLLLWLSLSEPQGCLLRLEDDAVLFPSDPVLLQLAPVSPPSLSHRLWDPYSFIFWFVCF